MSVLRKEAAPQDWIRELMKLADVNSNKKGGGGTGEFRDLQTRVIEMAPEMWKERIRNVPFLAKTKGIHGAAIDNIIDEILQGSEAEPQPIQDVPQPRVSDPVAPAVKEPLEEKMADAEVADCQEGQQLVAGSSSAASSGGVSAGSLNDSGTPSAKKPRMMTIPTPARHAWEAMMETLAGLRLNEAKQAEEILRLKARNSELKARISELEEQAQHKDDELEELQQLYEAETRKTQNLTKEKQRQIAQKAEEEKNVRAAKNLLDQKRLRLMNDSAGVGRHV